MTFIGFGLAYLLTGLILTGFGGGDFIADQDDYVAAGLIFFWPLFLVKYVAVLIYYIFYGIFYVIRHYGHRWFVIPVTIGKMFKRTFLTLFGKYKPSHYFDQQKNVILVNDKTGMEMDTGRHINEPKVIL